MQFYLHIKKTAEEEYRKNGIWDNWNDNKRFYLDEFPVINKLDWQAEIRDGLTDNLITRMTNFFTRIITSEDSEYYSIFHPNVERADAYKELVKLTLDSNNFPLVFADALKYSLLTSPYITKVAYELEEKTVPVWNDSEQMFVEPRRELLGKTVIKSVNPFNIMFDLTNDMFVIETEHIDLADFEVVARVNEWNERRLNRILEENRAILPQDTGEQNNIQKDKKSEDFRPTVKLNTVYCRYISDKGGEVLARNVMFIVANDKHVMKIDYNHLPSGQFPYIKGFPMKAIFKKWTRGYISRLKNLIKNYTDAYNLLLDSYKLATLGMFALDTDKIAPGDAHKFSRSIVPGMFYPMVGGTDGIRQLYTNDIPQAALQIVMLMDRTLQNRSYQNEFFQGAPTQRGRPTATEVNLKTQETTGFFTDIASEMERSIIIPTVELVLVTELMHKLTRDRNAFTTLIQENDQLAPLTSLTFEEAMDDILQSKIESKGISGKIIKLGNFQKFMQILGVLANIPPMVATLDPFKVVDRIFRSLDDDSESLIDRSNVDLVQQIMKSQLSGLAQPPQGDTFAGIGGNGAQSQVQNQGAI